MSEFDYFQGIVLGVIQGLTEFLPISSSGHLALTQRWLGLDADSPPMLLFDVLAHVGTLIAVGIVFARSARRFLVRLGQESSHAANGPRYAWSVVGLAVAATVPTAAIGLTFQSSFEAAFADPRRIGLCLLVTGAMLAALKMVRRGRRGWKSYRWWEAALIGIAQALAIFPGISRSGSTICFALYFGWRRRWAAEFSFLIAVPAIIGATALKIKDTIIMPVEHAAAMPWGAMVTGSIVSLVVGVLALRLLLTAVRRAKLHYFAGYCFVLAAIAILTDMFTRGGP